MKKHFYLFGEYVTRKYFEEGMDGVISLIDEFPDHHDIAIFEFDPGIMSPTELVAAADGWMGFAEITEHEYGRLIALGVRQSS